MPWSLGFSFGVWVAVERLDHSAGSIEPHLNVFDRRDVATSPDSGAGPTREQPGGGAPLFASDRKCLAIGDRRQHARPVKPREPVSAADRCPVDHDLGDGEAAGEIRQSRSEVRRLGAVELLKRESAPVEQRSGPGAVRAPRQRVDGDLGRTVGGGRRLAHRLLGHVGRAKDSHHGERGLMSFGRRACRRVCHSSAAPPIAIATSTPIAISACGEE